VSGLAPEVTVCHRQGAPAGEPVVDQAQHRPEVTQPAPPETFRARMSTPLRPSTAPEQRHELLAILPDQQDPAAGTAGPPQRWVAKPYQRQTLCRGLVQPESHAKAPGDSDLPLDAPTDGGAAGRRAGKLTGASR
jgi:hypothetical protein